MKIPLLNLQMNQDQEIVTKELKIMLQPYLLLKIEMILKNHLLTLQMRGRLREENELRNG